MGGSGASGVMADGFARERGDGGDDGADMWTRVVRGRKGEGGLLGWFGCCPVLGPGSAQWLFPFFLF
jgi:hypothetical protein